MAEEPILPELWALIGDALGPARDAGSAYIESGRYVPKVDMPSYEENDQGWPLVLSGRTAEKDGPPDWARLFSRHEGSLSYVLVDEIPELASGMTRAVQLAIGDPRVATMLSPVGVTSDDEHSQEFAEYGFLSLVGSILGRAEALGVREEAGLFELYRQLERGRLQEFLTGDVIVPLVLTSFDVHEPVQLTDNLWLERIEEDVQRARAMDWRSSDVASPWVAAAATHAVVWRGAVFKNIVWPPNFRKGGEKSPVPLDDFNHVVECIQIATGRKSGYAQVLVRPANWIVNGWRGDLPAIWRGYTVRAYPDDMDGGWLKPKRQIEADEVTQIAAMVPRLKASPKNILLAARRCRRAMFRTDVEDEILDATIGIEAMLGKGRDELTHRMSERAAVALSADYVPSTIYSLLKQVYGQRSAIVHGGVPKNSMVRVGEHEFRANHIAVFLLRNLLLNYLQVDEPWTPDSLDERMLDRMKP